jgi:hypothetical protein
MRLFNFFSRVLTTHRNCRGCCRKGLCHFCVKGPAPFGAFHEVEGDIKKVFLCRTHYVFIQTCEYAPKFIPEDPPAFQNLEREQIRSEIFKHEMFAGLMNK